MLQQDLFIHWNAGTTIMLVGPRCVCVCACEYEVYIKYYVIMPKIVLILLKTLEFWGGLDPFPKYVHTCMCGGELNKMV